MIRRFLIALFLFLVSLPALAQDATVASESHVGRYILIAALVIAAVAVFVFLKRWKAKPGGTQKGGGGSPWGGGSGTDAS